MSNMLLASLPQDLEASVSRSGVIAGIVMSFHSFLLAVRIKTECVSHFVHRRDPSICSS